MCGGCGVVWLMYDRVVSCINLYNCGPSGMTIYGHFPTNHVQSCMFIFCPVVFFCPPPTHDLPPSPQSPLPSPYPTLLSLLLYQMYRQLYQLYRLPLSIRTTVCSYKMALHFYRVDMWGQERNSIPNFNYIFIQQRPLCEFLLQKQAHQNMNKDSIQNNQYSRTLCRGVGTSLNQHTYEQISDENSC